MRYITPKRIISYRYKNNPPTWDIALLCFRNFNNINDLISHFKAKPIKRKVLWGFYQAIDRPNIFQAKIANKAILIVVPCNWGGPQAAILVEELACLRVKYIIGYGLAGSLDKKIMRGQQIIISSALTTDGTSKCYTKKKIIKPNSELLNIVKTPAPVKSATVDAIYRETKELINKWKKKGVQVINMETAPFYAASEKCNVKSIWLGYISDCLFSNWKDWHGKIKNANKESIKNCINIISNIKM